MARILIVEDEPTIAVGLQDDLELEGYDVELAGDGATAVTQAVERAYDLILLDLMLPQKDGFTVCREIRAAGLRMPIIILTAKGHEVDKVLGLELGADDYITKPFSSRELLARIKAALRRSQESASPSRICEFGDLKVDLSRCEAWRKGKKLSLTATEFKLLRAFVTQPGRVLTLDQLIEQVWGKDVFLTDRVIYTHINNLRSKIEADPSAPSHIVSLRGMGYRFDG